MNDALRTRLAKPFGEVLEFKVVESRIRTARPSSLIAVGDQTLIHLLEAGLTPDIGIFDLLCQRKEVPPEWKKKLEAAARREGGAIRAYNPPGTVQAMMEASVRDVLGQGTPLGKRRSTFDVAPVVDASAAIEAMRPWRHARHCWAVSSMQAFAG